MFNNQSKAKLTLASIVTTAILMSAPQAMAKGGKHKGGLNRIDTNGDGMIELTEATDAAVARVAKFFDHVDTDASGTVDFTEFSETRRGGTDLTVYADEIVQCVADVKEELGSTTIQVPTADMFLSPEDKFAMRDTDGDELITVAEAEASAAAKATEKFTNNDADADGFVTKEEMKAGRMENKGTKRVVRNCIKEVTEEGEI